MPCARDLVAKRETDRSRFVNPSPQVFAPHNAGAVGVFNHSDETFRLVDTGTILVVSLKAPWRTAAVVFVPFDAGSVGVFNANADAFHLVATGLTSSNGGCSNSMFNAGALGSNGKIYFAPRQCDVVGIRSHC